jgi:hypothetical protein
MKSLEFKEHRKRHYNEMELVRQYRMQHPHIEDEVAGAGAADATSMEDGSQEEYDDDADNEREEEDDE